MKTKNVRMGRKRKLLALTALFLSVVLLGCDKKNREQNPVEIVWDRDTCAECRMAVSDKRYGAQVIDRDGKAFFFDDIGCAVVWMKKQPESTGMRVWVGDANTTQWIEAKTANWFYGDPHTPMGYGYRATEASVENAISFDTVVKWIGRGKTLMNENRTKHMGEGHHLPSGHLSQ